MILHERRGSELVELSAEECAAALAAGRLHECIGDKRILMAAAAEDALRAQWAANATQAAIRAQDQQRGAAIDQDIATQALGQAEPKTVAELKAMTKAEFFAWFDANVTSQALAIALLKRLTLIVIRRVL